MSFRRGLVPFSASACLAAASRRERPFAFKPSRRLSRRKPSSSIMLLVRASPYLACVTLSQGHARTFPARSRRGRLGFAKSAARYPSAQRQDWKITPLDCYTLGLLV